MRLDDRQRPGRIARAWPGTIDDMNRGFLARLATLSLLAAPVVSSAAPFAFDRQLAIDLAIAYVDADFRARPAIAIPGIDFEHPEVTTAIAAQSRRYVFVTFSSSKAREGAFATFQVCADTPSLMPVDSGTTGDIGAMRAAHGAVGPETHVALPDGCRPEKE